MFMSAPKKPQPITSAADDKIVQDAADAARKRAMLAKGRKSTILAGLNEGLGSVGA